MNLTAEQLTQNAAAIIAYRDGKPIECLNRGGVEGKTSFWGKVFNPSHEIDTANFLYRPAPDPIAPGHNPDKLLVSQVGEGWRLLDEDEISYEKKEKRLSHIERWVIDGWVGNRGDWGAYKDTNYRTRLTREELAALDKPAWKMPTPPAGQQWHRDDFTEVDLPEGWRPLLKGEKIKSGDEWHNHSAQQWWKQHNDEQDGLYEGIQKHRTRRPLPSAPMTVPWDCPGDVPGPVCWLRTPQDRPHVVWLIVGIDETGVTATSGKDLDWWDFERYEHSTDRLNWKPCTKEAKA